MQRMSEVGYWTIQLMLIQPTQDDRIICCQRILRMLVFCVNLGAFNTVAEILSGVYCKSVVLLLSLYLARVLQGVRYQ